MAIHGYPDDVWRRAKEEARTILVQVAGARQVIAYSALASRLKSISFLASDQRFFLLLREISTDEHRAGRGMLTAVGDYKPGPGFFDLARGLGLDTSDTDRRWIEEIAKAHDYWSALQQPAPPA